MNAIPSSCGDTHPAHDGRRRFCQMAIGGMAAVSAGTVGYPIIAFLGLPKSLRPEESLEIQLDDLADGAAEWGEYLGRQIVIVKTGGEVRAFDGACTHLGCVVLWDGASRTFKCPCHGAAFDDSGTPVAGPVNIPLRKVEFEVKDGVLTVT